MALWQWSTTAANNATADPSINWQEGQPPSSVNDSARAMMAAIAAWFQAPEWLNYGLTPTYVSGTQFTVTGNQTAIYSLGRRVKAFLNSSTIYGTISSSSYTSLTTVTVSWDTSSVLDSTVSEVDVGIANPSNVSLPAISNYDAGGNGGQARWVSGNYGVMARNDGNNFYLLQTASGSQFSGFNSYRPFYWNLSNGAVTIDGTGVGVTCGGNITALSDESLKKDWEALPDDFIERLATVKSGTYTRIDCGVRQVGVGAQSLRPVLPEAVQDGEKLSVAYGQAALAACVELAKEVVRLREILESK